MQVRQSVVVAVYPKNDPFDKSEHTLRRVRDTEVSVPEERLPKPQAASPIPPKPQELPKPHKAFSTNVVIRAARNTDDVIISSGRRESTSADRRASQKHRHTHRPYWNSDWRPIHVSC